MKLNLNNEKKTILNLSLFFVGIVAVVFVVIFPTINYIKGLNLDTSNLKDYLEKKYDNSHTIKISKIKNEEIKNEITTYDSHLFYHGDELKLINILENIAADDKVNQKIDDSDLGKNTGNLIHISLTIDGDYQNLIKYIFDIEKSIYFIQIKHFHLVPFINLQDTGESKHALMNLELIIYVNKR